MAAPLYGWSAVWGSDAEPDVRLLLKGRLVHIVARTEGSEPQLLTTTTTIVGCGGLYAPSGVALYTTVSSEYFSNTVVV